MAGKKSDKKGNAKVAKDTGAKGNSAKNAAKTGSKKGGGTAAAKAPSSPRAQQPVPPVQGSQTQGGQPKHVAITMQYVKDLSFESPRAPHSLIANKDRPNINVNVDVRAQAVNPQQNIFEVTLALAATAKSGEEALFVAELAYSGLFTLTGLDVGAETEQALLIFCPSLLFPFARRIIADATRDGGFPPLMLDPIDFAQLYIRRAQAAA